MYIYDKIESKQNIDVIDVEKALAGYQAAINLFAYQGQINWNRFNVMLVANSIIIAVTVTILSGQHSLPFLILFFAFVGLALWIAWLLLSTRSFDYHILWKLIAEDLEKKYLDDVVRIFSTFNHFRNGGPVTFMTNHNDEKHKAHRFSKLSNILSQAPIAYVIITVFAIFYLLVVLYAIFYLCHN